MINHYVHEWGTSLSEAILEYDFELFTSNDIKGCIGYRVENHCAIVFGDPICPDEKIFELAQKFHEFCLENQLNAIYVCASEKFSDWAIQHICHIKLEIGEEPIFDPKMDPTEGPRGNKLRYKIKHAKEIGLVVKEYLSSDPKLEEEMCHLGKKWLASRKGPQIHLGELEFFKDRNYKRWFYAIYEGTIVGVAILSHLEKQKGWLLKFLIIDPEAPKLSSEFLMYSIMETLKKEDHQFLTNGIVPLSTLGEVVGLSSFTKFIAQMAFKISNRIFHFEDRKTFWRKFRPSSNKSFVLFSNPRIGLNEIRALIKTLNIKM